MPDPNVAELTRRAFIGGAASALAWAGLQGTAVARAIPPAARTAPGPLDLESGSGHWLGRRLWGNRLQDWQFSAGRVECVADRDMRLGRTVAVLDQEITDPSVELTVRTGTLEAGSGFSGLVIGTGVPGEDHRRRALVGPASGTGGGLVAYVDSSGRAGFLDHTRETDQLAWPTVAARTAGTTRARTTSEDLTLTLTIGDDGDDTVTITLAVTDTATGRPLSRATLTRQPTSRVRGGVALMSHAADSGARHWFAEQTGSGRGLLVAPDRVLGPVVGTLFTCMSGVLRMTAQLMPVDPRDLSSVGLELSVGGTWQQVGTAPVGPGYAATFRVTGQPRTVARGYRIVGGGRILYEGTIPAEPTERLRIATFSCLIASARPVDADSSPDAGLPRGTPMDLYSARGVYFPHDELVDSMTARRPDLLVAHGDQLYEFSPTRKDTSTAPELDFLYKFLLWHWSVRSLTRRVPTIVLTDDHDVFQGNLWGEGGVATTDMRTGGYVNEPDWVNLVQRVSSWHNPEPHDARTISQGITVCYSAFRYGGTSFALVEDRKFKSAPIRPGDPDELLGARQEAFLEEWAGMHPGLPKVLLTGTTWACVQTKVDGRPNADKDSNGWPPAGRLRAVRAAKAAQALILSGDQHVGHLVRHGIDGFDDGPLQFTPPAGGSLYQRWFQPQEPLRRGTGTPCTGEFTDGFGNRLRVLAVVNPAFTLSELREHVPPPDQGYGDRSLKREGFGLVVMDHDDRHVELECWPWHTASSGAGQFDGFPVGSSYDDL